ncbi:MAG: NAD(P)/FAD-dependent oxidoreductase [Bacteroidales bacterium]|nr:NAD(P)/FAD-dependent oxidoreductase [Bacteroidales bacterium]
MEKRDICIVGGGISGSLAAQFLAKKHQQPCTLIDKSEFPRHKICGDGVSGWVVNVLKELDGDLPGELLAEPFVLPSYGIRIAAPNYKYVDLPFDPDAVPGEGIPPGFTAQRYHLDYFLLKKAKSHPLVECYEKTEVTGFQATDKGFRLQLNSGQKEMTARIVLFAQGAGSFGPPGINTGGNPVNTFIGLRGYYKNVAGFHAQNFIELHFLKDILPGYLWIFPMAGGIANVGIGMMKKHILKRKVSLKGELHKILNTHPLLKERFRDATEYGPLQAHAIPLWKKKEKICGDGYMALGDAARLVDPVTGEGMGHAALSAKYAAETASLSLLHNRFDAGFMHRYDEELFKTIGRELDISRKISYLIRRPFLLNTFMNKAGRNPRLAETLAASMGNLDTRKQLKNPLFYLKMLIG